MELLKCEECNKILLELKHGINKWGEETRAIDPDVENDICYDIDVDDYSTTDSECFSVFCPYCYNENLTSIELDQKQWDFLRKYLIDNDINTSDGIKSDDPILVEILL